MYLYLQVKSFSHEIQLIENDVQMFLDDYVELVAIIIMPLFAHIGLHIQQVDDQDLLEGEALNFQQQLNVLFPRIPERNQVEEVKY